MNKTADKKKQAPRGVYDDERKKAIAIGKAQAKIVRRYLELVNMPKTSSPMTPERLRKRIAQLDSEMQDSSIDVLARLKMAKQQRELIVALAEAGEVEDLEEVEEAFMQIAADYSEAQGLEWSDWRRLGVKAAVLREAGVPLTFAPKVDGLEVDKSTGVAVDRRFSVRYSQELKDKAIRMIRENEGSFPSNWACLVWVVEQLGDEAPRAETLRQWYLKAKKEDEEDKTVP